MIKINQEEKNSVICPYCKKQLVDINNQLNECEHFVSVQDDFIDWADGKDYISDIDGIVNEYIEDASKQKLKHLTKGLKIDKELRIDGYWNYSTIEDAVMFLTDEVFILHENWDSNRPGGSGTWKYLFINDHDKAKWVFDELKVLYQRLIEYDKNNKAIW